MLGSITPLGERGRGQRWGVTVTAHVLGAALAGAAIGAVLGGIGAMAPGAMAAAWRVAALVVGLVGAVVVDLAAGPGRLPGARRQVNEDWLHRYRGWVYGVGFGAQLGLGVATIVTTSAVYATWAAALLSGSGPAGALIGGTFGLVRAAVLLVAARARTADRAYRIDGRLQRWAAPARWAAVAAQGALLAATAAAIVR